MFLYNSLYLGDMTPDTLPLRCPGRPEARSRGSMRGSLAPLARFSQGVPEYFGGTAQDRGMGGF
jgi:hypothetical protein